MAVSYQVIEKGQAVFIVYDVPARLDGDRGRHPQGFQSMLRKFLDSGRVRRVQASVLAVEDPALIEPLLNLILRYGGAALLIEGSYNHYLSR
jgi:hypothetical protein